ncbi:MAG: SGNH/GDSL hydrolase family protein [Cyclobacteriaceae bacterium]
MRKLILIICLFTGSSSFAQEHWIWNDPMEAQVGIIHGQAWEGIKYHRLPDEAEKSVRSPVWHLSRHSAGVKLRFNTNADRIKVRYTVKGNLDMPHMPATGVSGLDLYTKNKNEDWIWVKGNYSFKDTIQYEFVLNDGYVGSREFDLYLPLYNEVLELEIGTGEKFEFSFLEKNKSKLPILVYGTSIAHGACASRPGMAWTAILERKINQPLINLGFSGNGQLEKPIIDYMSQTESLLYVLDCIPNLVRDEFSEEEVTNRILQAVRQLKGSRPEVPILLVEHAGYMDEWVNFDRKEAYKVRNEWTKNAFKTLIWEGVEDIYLLEKEEIGLTMDATVDGTHPSDLGMQQYAEGYYRIILEILDKGL